MPTTWDIILNLDTDFIARFIKAKGALKEVNTFTLLMNKKTNKLELVIGYSKINSNRISLAITPEAGKDTADRAISFSAKYFKEILTANSESTSATLNVSMQGISFIQFSSADYESSYYLTEIPQAD